MKYLYALFVLCLFVLNFSTVHANNPATPTNYAYEWSDGSYAAYNNLVIENITTVDIPCFGDTRGTVTIEVSGATPPITYDIGVAGTVTVQDTTYTFFQSLDADTYNLTVTDADGCVAFDVFTINEPSPLQITSTPIAETLPGTGDGSVSICVQGGTPPYIVTTASGATIVQVAGACSGNFEVNDLSAGSYAFDIEDANGCRANDLVEVAAGTCIGNVISSVSTDSGASFCKDGIPDEILMENSIDGMVGIDYAYVLTNTSDTIVLWNPSADFYDIDLLTPGVYRIYGFNYQGVLTVPVGGSINDISSSADCVSLSDDYIEVELFASPSTAVAGADVNLCGPSTVNLNADSVAIGTGVWTQISGVPATIADTLSANTDVSNLLSGTYQFEWAVSNGVCPDSRDTVQILIGDTSIEIDTITVTNETCNTNNDGSATISVSGALAPINYNIENAGINVTVPDTSYTIPSGLSAGSYFVTVTDAAGCFVVDSFNISQPDSLYIQPMVTAVTEVGMSDGLIILCVEGGEEPYILTSISGVSIDSIDGPCAANYAIDSLAAGTYIFNLEDVEGCTASETVVVAPGDCAIRIDSVVVNSNVSCFDGNDGQLTVYADGGNPGNYQYSIDNGLSYTPAPSSLSFTNLTAGTYDIIVVDELGCQDTFINNSITVTAPIAFDISQINTIDVSAPGANDGQIDFCINGGVPPYTATYIGMDMGASGLFSDTGGVCAGNFLADNLPGDTYTIEITDSNGCTEKIEVFVDDVDCGPFTIVNVIPTNVACNGDSTGTIEMITSGGFAPYDFVIDDGANSDTTTVNTASHLFTNLPFGNYTLTAIHSDDCAVQNTIFITEPSALSAEITTIDPTEIGGMDGEICIHPMGGAMSYTLTSSCGGVVEAPGNCGGTHHISGLGAGECTITIVDDNGCIYSTTAELISPSCAGFSLVSVTPTDVSCAGDNNGFITIEVTGGEPIYRYSIDGGNIFIENTNSEYTFENVDAGDYNILVEDGRGCEVSFASLTISEPLPISIEIETTETCIESADGSIDITPSGGTGAYTYFWETGSVDEDIDQLAAGSYSLTVTDANSCMSTSTIPVAEFPSIEVNLGGNQIINASDSIQFMPDVNTMENFTFSWSPTTDLSDTLSLTPWASPPVTTTYILTITSEEGCKTSDEIIISVNPVRPIVAVPSAFTPNDDSENDELNVIVQGNFEFVGFHIFNRWGEEIFFSANVNTGWDGTYKGEKQPVGTYVYVVEYRDLSGNLVQEGGDVTLLR